MNDMTQPDSDRIMRQALTPTETKRLPSNFAYNTMRRIRREQLEAERRSRMIAIAVIIGVSLLGLVALVHFLGSVLWQSFSDMFRQPGSLSLVVLTLICLLFFALLNHWLARRFRANKQSGVQV